MKKIIILCLPILFISSVLSAQIRKIPAEVITAFEKQYPSAQTVEYKDVLTSVNVHFVMDSIKMNARYTNGGEWKETEKEWNYYNLPQEVKDGYMKSKYADGEWEVKETTVILLPGDVEQYRLRVDKGDIQKRYLYFDQYGRLLRDPITI